MKSATGVLLVSGMAAAGLRLSTASRVQSQNPPKEFVACYVTTSGTTYRIKEPGLRTECQASHIEFRWNHEGPQGQKGDKGDPGTPGNLALAGKRCAQGQFLVGFDAVGALVCSTIGGGNGDEVCDGFDNNGNGEIDEGLPYCFNGRPSPNTNGTDCLSGFVDQNGDPRDGCESVLGGHVASHIVFQAGTPVPAENGGWLVWLSVGETVRMRVEVLDQFNVAANGFVSWDYHACGFAAFSDGLEATWNRLISITAERPGDCDVVVAATFDPSVLPTVSRSFRLHVP